MTIKTIEDLNNEYLEDSTRLFGDLSLNPASWAKLLTEARDALAANCLALGVA